MLKLFPEFLREIKLMLSITALGGGGIA